MEHDLKFKEKALLLCREYLQGPWKRVKLGDFQLDKISGGLSNFIFRCSILTPVKTSAVNGGSGIPSEVLLRIHGAGGKDDDEENGESGLRVIDNVVFTILSERGLGPHLYGVFAEGRLEQFIPGAKSLNLTDLRDPKLSGIVARKMAKMHALTAPINKEPEWLESNMNKFAAKVALIDPERIPARDRTAADSILGMDFRREIDWVLDYISRVHSPVVFCHNDLQGGNILLRQAQDGETEEDEDCEDRIMLIDFEFCGYNYRGFDLANHFTEWVFDYNHSEFPFYKCRRDYFPSRKRQLDFFNAYLEINAEEDIPGEGPPHQRRSRAYSAASAAASNEQNGRRRVRHISCQHQTEILFREVQAFTIASNLLWTMWAANQAVSDKKIAFGFWHYSADRLKDYVKQKEAILRTQ